MITTHNDIADSATTHHRDVRVGQDRKPALHLVDIENLMGDPRATPDAEMALAVMYGATTQIGPDDDIVVSANPARRRGMGQIWPGARILTRGGANGADICLIECVADTRSIAARYGRIVIGSGDGAFATVAEIYRKLGLVVHVVCNRGSVSRELRRAASTVRYLSNANGHNGRRTSRSTRSSNGRVQRPSRSQPPGQERGREIDPRWTPLAACWSELQKA